MSFLAHNVNDLLSKKKQKKQRVIHTGPTNNELSAKTNKQRFNYELIPI